MSVKLLSHIKGKLSTYPYEQLEKVVDDALFETEVIASLLDSSFVSHIVVDLESKVVLYTNKATENILSRESRKKIRWGTSISQLYIDKDVKEYIEKVLNGGKKEMMDFSFEKGGEIRTYRMSFYSFSIRKRNLLDIKMEDISEKLKDEVRLRRSESLASMTTMAAGIAHEIKNPLAAMKIHLQLLVKECNKKEKVGKEEVLKYLSVIDEEIDRINKIAVDFLFAVRPMDTELKLSSLNILLKDIADFIRPEAEEKGINVNLSLDPFVSNVFIDSRYIKQCVLNIAENAISAMEGGGKLTFQTLNSGDFVYLNIIDTGCGMTKEEMERIFEPYYTTRANGTGLGLTVVYKIVKEHKGDILVKSEKGRGTTFTIKFPIPRSERKVLGEK